ncbi:MAG TPA: DUF4388 domain-containing protein, partial [Candidatus Dormibacteraeota bacterium]|nr:DUF4388 domain-containing protein [Candidatus Dormibacteraeota bacterium]
MQSSGTLAELSLEGILDTVQKDRATGTLHLRGSEGEATLYFLFGHLFHAVDASDQQGVPVVHKALGWGTGDFTFDAKAKLPAEETIKVSTAELLASRPAANGGSAGSAAAVATEEDAVTEPEPATEPGANGAHAPAETGAAGASASEPEVSAQSAEPEPEPEPEVPAASEAAGATSSSDDDVPRRRGTDKRPGTRPPETMALYPMPKGKSLHEGLTAGFVDFPKLLRSLAKDAHSGYVRLSGEGFTGVLLFSSGAVVEAIYDAEAQVGTGTAAFSSFGDRIDAGEGDLDVIQLSPEMVTGIYQLLTSPSTYDRLLARFIKADALLEHLAEQNTSGALIVRNKDSVGIVLFREGQVLGSYTEAAREVSDSTAGVVAICDDPATEIEVRGGDVPATLSVMEPGQGAPREVPSGSASAMSTSSAPAEAPAVEAVPAAEQEPVGAEEAAPE